MCTLTLSTGKALLVPRLQSLGRISCPTGAWGIRSSLETAAAHAGAAPARRPRLPPCRTARVIPLISCLVLRRTEALQHQPVLVVPPERSEPHDTRAR